LVFFYWNFAFSQRNSGLPKYSGGGDWYTNPTALQYFVAKIMLTKISPKLALLKLEMLIFSLIRLYT
jgi:hypothetical protein